LCASRGRILAAHLFFSAMADSICHGMSLRFGGNHEVGCLLPIA
jgi:hypothetical protein